MIPPDPSYEQAVGAASRALTTTYSTSFSLGIRLFARHLRQPIYDIYGLVRLADEIVDSWHDLDQAMVLDDLEHAVMQALMTGFSLNPVIHAYARTARTCQFESAWTTAFFASMRADLQPDPVVTAAQLGDYVYGSAEVIGLMCLAVFCNVDRAGNDTAPLTSGAYARDAAITRTDVTTGVGAELVTGARANLTTGARALGSAFQKINFLRDIAADHKLGRTYFPAVRAHGLTDSVKAGLVDQIKAELAVARPAVHRLPASSRRGVALALRYYEDLLVQLEHTPASVLAERRIRVSDARKLTLLVAQLVGR